MMYGCVNKSAGAARALISLFLLGEGILLMCSQLIIASSFTMCKACFYITYGFTGLFVAVTLTSHMQCHRFIFG